jgi:hypothetical protein
MLQNSLSSVGARLVSADPEFEKVGKTLSLCICYRDTKNNRRFHDVRICLPLTNGK